MPTFTAFKNFAFSTLSAGISAGASSLTMASGQGARFHDDSCICVIWSSSYESPALDPNREIILADKTAGDTFNITRAQEGTSAAGWSAGDNVANIVTAAKMLELETAFADQNLNTTDSPTFVALTLDGPINIGTGAAGQGLVEVQYTSATDPGIWAESTVYRAIYGKTAGASQQAIYGDATGAGGIGVFGKGDGATSVGVSGWGVNSGTGIAGTTDNGKGGYFQATGTGKGVEISVTSGLGIDAAGTGADVIKGAISGTTAAASAVTGVCTSTGTGGSGVYGESDGAAAGNAAGVYGYQSGTGSNDFGVLGEVVTGSGVAVKGDAAGTATGLLAVTVGGIGVDGQASSGVGVKCTSLTGVPLRVIGVASAPTGAAGDIYYDTATNKHYGHNGTAWQAMY